ncbi:MAG: hypothetical protein A2126_02940 [Candidatus Woykebacteria bacterium GWB1_45_5]|uniref:Uncharacterized protein n=2 Tax=Candidatus Woykeibacteriota TaxID=1817899 RepID=A0A1G1W2Q3_9BACT|nr:MAG: hypothetical protein A2113_00870 [Candidatus Woykebacteria bacterium GWA1_44_8]OGY22839.1 MAG: hypothetical protein A2126_02940 [Candidatus Woykebacteria bacterium GWB1_45_5]
MKAAKIISVIGGVFFLFIWIGVLISSLKIGGVYEDINIGYNPLLPVIIAHLIGFGLVTANFGYVYYLIHKEKSGQVVKHAILYSILLALVPLLVYPMILVFSLIFPIYSLTSGY